MNLKALRSRFEDAIVRIEESICIATAVADYTANERLERALEDPDQLKCLGMPASLVDDLESGVEPFIEWAEQEGKLGWLVQFATPVMRTPPRSTSGSYHWGSYYTEWVYGDTFAQAVEAGFAWVARIRDDEKRKAAGPVPA